MHVTYKYQRSHKLGVGEKIPLSQRKTKGKLDSTLLLPGMYLMEVKP